MLTNALPRVSHGTQVTLVRSVLILVLFFKLLKTETKEEFYHPSLNFPHGPVATPTKKSRRMKNAGKKVLNQTESGWDKGLTMI